MLRTVVSKAVLTEYKLLPRRLVSTETEYGLLD